MRTLIVIAALWSQLALAAAPQTGIWWSPSESGRGYSIDVQGSTLVLISYAYDSNGRMQWYYADGPLLNGGARWSGALYKFDFGQPLNGPYSPPVNLGTDGVVTIDFSSRSAGTLTLPQGRQVSIQRYNFGVGTPPQSLLGTWIYVYSIGASTFADRYNYTVTAGATSTGNGVVADAGLTGAAEYQVTGALAGLVAAFHYSPTGAVLDAYVFTQYLEEGRGSWVSLQTSTQYGMNAYRIISPSGMPKLAARVDEEEKLASSFEKQRSGITIDELTRKNPAAGELARQFWERLERARQEIAP